MLLLLLLLLPSVTPHKYVAHKTRQVVGDKSQPTHPFLSVTGMKRGRGEGKGRGEEVRGRGEGKG